MTIQFLTTVLAVTAGLVVTGSTIHAGPPLDVDCESLAATNECVNAILDEQGVQFQNLGELVSTAILDEAVFEQLDALILLCSEGTIDFESASQAISTNAKCGLIRQLLEDIAD